MTPQGPPPLAAVSEPTLESILQHLLAETGWTWAEASIRVMRGTHDASVPIASAGTPDAAAVPVLHHAVVAPREELPAGLVRAASSQPVPPPAHPDRVALLVSAASGHVLREWAAHEQRRLTAIADPALTQTLRSVRSAEDSLGNALGVVLGWLRLLDSGMTGSAARDGIPVAIRRLGALQGTMSDFLRDTATKAIGEHARQRVNATAALAQAWRRPPAAGDPVLVLGNRSHILDFLAAAKDLTAAEPSVVDGQWVLPIDRPGDLGSAAMSSLTASGGVFLPHLGGHAAAWTVIEETS